MEYKIDAESFFECVDSMDGTYVSVARQETPYKHSIVEVLGVWLHVPTQKLVGGVFLRDYEDGILDAYVTIQNNMVPLKPVQEQKSVVYSLIEG